MVTVDQEVKETCHPTDELAKSGIPRRAVKLSVKAAERVTEVAENADMAALQLCKKPGKGIAAWRRFATELKNRSSSRCASVCNLCIEVLH